jgi:hypothetical protein
MTRGPDRPGGAGPHGDDHEDHDEDRDLRDHQDRDHQDRDHQDRDHHEDDHEDDHEDEPASDLEARVVDLTTEEMLDLTDEETDMTATTLARPPLSNAAVMLLERSRAGLLHAVGARTCGERYVAAHLAALRAAAAVLAVRGRPSSRGGPRSVWEVLPRVAPEMGEWAAFFAATASRRAAVEAGRGDIIGARDADDLLRDAETFYQVVEASFGLPHQAVLPGALPACD